MSINVKTENAHDATIQVHIAFENAGRHHRPRRNRATRTFNRAFLRDGDPVGMTTGRNKATHRSSTKARLRRSENEHAYSAPLLMPPARHPA